MSGLLNLPHCFLTHGRDEPVHAVNDILFVVLAYTESGHASDFTLKIDVEHLGHNVFGKFPIIQVLFFPEEKPTRRRNTGD